MAKSGMPWETGATEGKYRYYPGGDEHAPAKNAPSAVNVVVVPDVNLPKVRLAISFSLSLTLSPRQGLICRLADEPAEPARPIQQMGQGRLLECLFVFSLSVPYWDMEARGLASGSRGGCVRSRIDSVRRALDRSGRQRCHVSIQQKASSPDFPIVLAPCTWSLLFIVPELRCTPSYALGSRNVCSTSGAEQTHANDDIHLLSLDIHPSASLFAEELGGAT